MILLKSEIFYKKQSYLFSPKKLWRLFFQIIESHAKELSSKQFAIAEHQDQITRAMDKITMITRGH